MKPVDQMTCEELVWQFEEGDIDSMPTELLEKALGWFIALYMTGPWQRSIALLNELKSRRLAAGAGGREGV